MVVLGRAANRWVAWEIKESLNRRQLEIGFVRTADDRQNKRVFDVKVIPWFANASRRKRWLVGVSGGADSVALLHLLVGQGFSNLVVCHLDHRLRGRASAGDAAFVKSLAGELGVACEMGRIDVATWMNERGESMETAARNARHLYFADCAAKHRCPRLVLAHHADDQAETVLWNLLRGSHGLKGMKEEQSMAIGRRRLMVCRPLLEFSGTDLRAWLTERGLEWREDASNREPVAVRNRLRHEVLPRMAEISGRNPAEAIGRSLEGMRDLEAIETWAVENSGTLDPQGRLHLPALRTLPTALQRAVIAAFLKAAGVGGIDRSLMLRVMSLMDPDSPPAVNLPGGGAIRRRAGRMLLEGR